jgi:hypothetical protein
MILTIDGGGVWRHYRSDEEILTNQILPFHIKQLGLVEKIVEKSSDRRTLG